jgi:hypothetical protein
MVLAKACYRDGIKIFIRGGFSRGILFYEEEREGRGWLPLVQCWNLTEFMPLVVEIPKSWESFFFFFLSFVAPLFKD